MTGKYYSCQIKRQIENGNWNCVSVVLSWEGIKSDLTCQRSPRDKIESKKTSIKCLSSDYDGTISPLNVSRLESRVPLETRVMLGQIGRFLPISIITMKDLSFIMPRTPFAYAWSAIGGLEMRIGKRVLKREDLEHKLRSISIALDYAKSQITISGAEIEEKQDSEGQTVAFCVDWRRVSNPMEAKRRAERVAAFCRAARLRVIRSEGQPFYDVYPVAPDKGRALQEMLEELALNNAGILYLGDSEMDNSAFKASTVSVGVQHDETVLDKLDCEYFVEFKRVPEFLNALMANNFLFTPDLPMIKINPRRCKVIENH